MPPMLPRSSPTAPGVWASATTWGARVAWLAVAVIGGRAVGDAVAARSDAVQWVATVGAWGGWAAGAVALTVPSVATLTAARAVVPGALAVTVATLVFGVDAGAGLALAVTSIVAAVLVGAAETGRAFVQSSAYGDEQRFLLRPPYGYLSATVASWVVWVTAVITAPLAWAARSWVLAVVATVVAVGASWLLPRRWGQLSRRWFVCVPAGLVVHDPVLLGETLMMQRHDVALVGLAHLSARTATAEQAFDLTGPTPGLAVEVTLRQPATALLAPRPDTPRGRAIHLSAVLVAPSRPGSVLREVARRGHPTA